MDSIRNADHTSLELMLEKLEEQRRATLDAVDNYARQVITAGKALAQGEDEHKHEFSEIYQRICNTMEFLCLKQTEFSEKSDYNFSSNTTKALKEQDISEGCTQFSLKEDDVKRTLDNLNASKVQEEKLTENEQQIQKMIAKFDQMENFTSKSLAENKQQIQKMTAKFDQMKKFAFEFQKLREQFEILSGNLHKLQETCFKINKDVGKKLKCERSKINEDVQKKLTKLKDMLCSQFTSLQDEIYSKITENEDTMFTKLQDEINFKVNEVVENKLAVVGNETEALKDYVTSSLDKNNSVLEKVSARTGLLEKDLADMSEGVSAKLEIIENVLVKEDRSGMTIEDIQERLLLLETREMSCLESVLEKLEEVEKNAKIVHQMLITRLKPLEQLRQILNEKFKDRNKNITKLQELMKDMATLSPRVSLLEMQSRGPVVGFTASATNFNVIGAACVVSKYDNISCNAGNHFNPESGVFTVSEDGVYFVNIKLTCGEGYNLLAEVSSGNLNQGSILISVSQNYKTGVCHLYLFDVKAGDALSVKVLNQSGLTPAYAKNLSVVKEPGLIFTWKTFHKLGTLHIFIRWLPFPVTPYNLLWYGDNHVWEMGQKLVHKYNITATGWTSDKSCKGMFPPRIYH